MRMRGRASTLPEIAAVERKHRSRRSRVDSDYGNMQVCEGREESNIDDGSKARNVINGIQMEVRKRRKVRAEPDVNNEINV